MTFDAKAVLAKTTLRKKEKTDSPENIRVVEEVGKQAGFPSREASHTPKKRGRPKSVFTAQFHAMLKPEDFEYIQNQAKTKGMQYGAVISELIGKKAK